MAGTGKRMRAGMGETMEAAATGAANAHLFILFTPVLKGGVRRVGCSGGGSEERTAIGVAEHEQGGVS